MKKIIFTEAQMKHILGEDFVSYLNKDDNGCDIPKDSNIVDYEEVTDTEPGMKPKTLDKYGREKVMSNPAFVRSYYTTIYEDKKKQKIDERNHELDGKTFNLGKKTSDTVNAVASNNSGDEMVNNMSTENGATANSLYVRQNRLNKMKKEDPIRYARINGKQLQKGIKDTLNRATASTKTNKNQFQKTVNNMTPDANRGVAKGGNKEGNLTVYYNN